MTKPIQIDSESTTHQQRGGQFYLAAPFLFHQKGGPIVKDIQFNPQQAEAISHREGPMIVLSVAGSGRTMVLTERVIPL